jgi:predicted amidohydrolase YtcJ
MNGFCHDQVPRLENHANGFLTIRSVKLFLDGALGSWGAALLEDYSDRPGVRGSMLLNDTQLEDLIRQAFTLYVLSLTPVAQS